MIRTYLADGVYVDFDGCTFRLWTERETGVHEIFLEPHAITTLNAFASQIIKAAKDAQR